MSENPEIELVMPELATETAAAAAVVAETMSTAEPVKVDDSMLTEAEKKTVNEFSEKIDITNSAMVMQYGASAQRKISEFSDSALNNVRTKDFGEVGDMLSELVTELKGFDIDEGEKGLAKLFKKSANKITGLKAKFDKAEVNVDKISAILEGHQVTLLKDVAVLDQLHEKNQVNIKELTMYIIAGKKKLEKVRSVDIPELRAKAEASGSQEDAQAVNDLENYCDRFEKKLHDLELTRIVSVQMVPQIRLVQNNDTLMVEKIQSTLVNTIPLWKSQMILALGLEHSSQAIKAQREVNEMTNELLRKNAEKVKMATIETAKESERGIVDIETVRNTNRMLIETLDEVARIQKEGREKRRAAEEEISRIEGELKAKLLEVRS